MTYQITLSDQECSALAAAATKSGTEPEQLLHDMIQCLQPSSQSKSPLTARELAENQYREGKISHFRRNTNCNNNSFVLTVYHSKCYIQYQALLENL
jgi:hypothetical protein